MFLYKDILELQMHLKRIRNQKNKIGFVPTMGALHEGHLSLIRHSIDNNDVTVSSIFVNPTQFNNNEDFAGYPRTFEGDMEKLISNNVDILFYPATSEMYPDGFELDNCYNLSSMTSMMEGKYRPGHFDGVVQIVKKFLQIIVPDTLYMGQKDYQQFIIIKKLISLMGIDCRIVMCPIVREKDGLAMSSRNVRLKPNERKDAAQIYKALHEIKIKANTIPLAELQQSALNTLNSLKTLTKVDYIEVVNSENLRRIDDLNQCRKAIACIAVQVGAVRLIDNIFIS